jgi:hypothetical protein
MCEFSEQVMRYLKSARNGISGNSTTSNSADSSALKTNRFGWLALAHPFLIAVLPIAIQYSENVGQTQAFIAFRLMGIALLVAAVLLGLVRLAMRNMVQATIAASVFLGLFYTYGRVFDFVAFQKKIVMTHGVWHAALLSFWLAAFVVCTVLIRQSRRDWRPLARFLTSVSTILLVIAFWNICKLEHEHSKQLAASKGAANLTADQIPDAANIENDSAETSDVYYIILDAYTREDVLRNVYGYDNSEFLNGLRSKGFYIAEESYSNYPYTFMSVPSALNMRFLETEIQGAEGQSHPSYWPCMQLIRSPVVPRIFQSKGYQFVHFATNIALSETSHIADRIVTYQPGWLQNEFTQVLFRTTALRMFESNSAQIHLNAFKTLKEIPEIPGPTFTFAHIVCPHRPFVFDCNGTVLDDRQDLELLKEQRSNYRDGYIGQLQFVNKMITGVVEEILAKSKTPPIIIIQGDHGTASLAKGTKFQPLRNMDFLCRERLPILNAYYVPEKMREKLYPTITPVNSFRLLLTECFNENFPPLPDRSFMGWYNSPFQLTDMTEHVHALGAPSPEEVEVAMQPAKPKAVKKTARRPKKDAKDTPRRV